MSTRGTVIDTLATELAKITTANGYVSNVESVLRDRLNWESMSLGDVSLTISDTGPDRDLQSCASGKIRASATVQIIANVKGTVRGTPPTSGVNAILADIRKCVRQPIALGANVRFVELGDIPEIWLSGEEYDTPLGVVRISVTINYWYDGANP